jgi:Integrase core domain
VSSGKLYLAAVLDLFSRFVVGWGVSAVNDRHVALKALDMALKRRCPDVGLLHHADQGCTYASEDYQDVLEANGITCSMSRRGNCYDNAVMESFFSSVKSEVADRFDSCGEAKMELFDYIEVFYNQRRRHSTLGQISPAAFERRATRTAQQNRPRDRINAPVGNWGADGERSRRLGRGDDTRLALLRNPPQIERDNRDDTQKRHDKAAPAARSKCHQRDHAGHGA